MSNNSIKDQILNGAPLLVGYVIKCEHNFPPLKSKFQIAVGLDANDLAIVFINSEINMRVHSTQEAQDLQVEILVDSNPFLSYISFVDCTRITVKSTHVFLSALQNDASSDCFVLDNNDLTIILNTLKSSPSIKTKDKKRFGFI